MSVAPSPPAAPTLPDPQPDRAAAVLPRVALLLGLVHKLIDYGRHLATSLQRGQVPPGRAPLVYRFGTSDIGAIIARIIRGLHRAAALQDRLTRRAATGRDLLSPSARRAPRKPRAPRPMDPAQETPVLRLPSREEIAAAVRRRPIGAVIAEICCDLGIMPGLLSRAEWEELALAITTHGGSLSGFFKAIDARVFAARPAEPPALALPAPLPLTAPAPSTGPP